MFKIFRQNNKCGSLKNKIFFAVFAMLFVLSLGFSNAQNAEASFSDTESSASGLFSAGMLDFELFNTSFETQIGSEALGEKVYASIAMPVNASMDMQYELSNSIVNDPDGLCSELDVVAKQNGITKYSGPLSGLSAPASEDFGSWEFDFDLPVGAPVGHGEKCDIDAVFSAWRKEIPSFANSGFTDTEKTQLSFTARMVVLNEIFARPNGGIAPKDREYIELYNNGDTAIDTLGWNISEVSGVTETFYPIVASGAVSGEMMPYNGASTIIPAGGFLVLEFGGGSSHLNNSGDTVRLYDSSTTLLDSHTYPSIAAGKAVVRFPDGIGFWVDPEPTPGSTNMVSLEDLKLSGFTDEMIAQVLELAKLMGITLLQENLEEEKIINETSSVLLPEVVSPEVVLSEDDPIVNDELSELSDTTVEETIDGESQIQDTQTEVNTESMVLDGTDLEITPETDIL